MKKKGLEDLRKQNSSLILNLLLQEHALSRTELAERTGLSGSTVSSVCAQLLEQGWILETGSGSRTAGRTRRDLCINPDYGWIAVVETTRKSVWYSLFDLDLQKKAAMQISDHYVSGNELLELISKTIEATVKNHRLLSIGLLYQEDMKASDFNILYNTGIYSDTIPLKTALQSAFRVNVYEDYSQHYTITKALAREQAKDHNVAHIMLGQTIAASVTVDGKTVMLDEGFCRSRVKEAEGKYPAQLASFIVLIASMFPIRHVFLSGIPGDQEYLIHSLNEDVGKTLGKKIRVESLSGKEDPLPDMAEHLRSLAMAM